MRVEVCRAVAHTHIRRYRCVNAIHHAFLTWIAMVVEVEVRSDGAVIVPRVADLHLVESEGLPVGARLAGWQSREVEDRHPESRPLG
jgi:hypothetical protein